MGLSEAGETAATVLEAADLGFRAVKMSCPSPVAVIVAGEVEALASDVAGLKLDDASSGDVAGEGLWPEAEVEEVMVVGATSVHVFGEGAVSEVKGPKESEVERAWRGEEEWREGNEGTEGVGNEGEDGVQQEKGEEGKGAKFSYPRGPAM